MACARSAVWALALLLVCVAHLTHTAAAGHAIPVNAVRIEPGTLPEAKWLSTDGQRVGEWQLDFTGPDEDAFYDAENKATRQWREWRNQVRSLRAYRQQQQQQENTAGADTGAKDGDAAAGATGQASALANYFGERSVQRRIQSRIKKQAGFNLSTEEGVRHAWSEVGADIGTVWSQLKEAGTSATPTDEAYLDLVKRHFSHTYSAVNMAPSTSSAAASNVSSSFPSLALLRTPVVLEAEVLPNVEKELQHLRVLWQRRSDAVSNGKAEPLQSAAEKELSAVADLVNGSRASFSRIIALADPIADAAASWVATSLVASHAAFVANDGSTEAKQLELKQLLKHRSRLQKAKEALARHSLVYKNVLRRNHLPTADSVLFALELLAAQRLGDSVRGTVEVLPKLSTTAPLTGLLKEEWMTHVVYPFALCLLITAAFIWLAEEVKEWCLRRVQASRVRIAVGGRSPRGAGTSSTGRVRKLFLFSSLLETLAPPLLPVLILTIHCRGVSDWATGVVMLMRPSQRVVCVVALLCLTLANYLCGLVVRRLFHFIDPSVYRRRYAKTK